MLFGVRVGLRSVGLWVLVVHEWLRGSTMIKRDGFTLLQGFDTHGLVPEGN